MSFFGRPYNGENSMLLPTADPIVSKIQCPECRLGKIEDDEGNEIPCPDCDGTMIREVWR